MTIKETLEKITGYENLDLYDNSAYIDNWEDWYRGKVDDFHNYTIYNGKKEVPFTRYSLGMAKRACEDWANLLINEKTDITLDNEAGQAVLENVLYDCHFWRKANLGIEKTFALGIGAFVVSVDGLGVDEHGRKAVDREAKVKVSFINGQKIIPITIEDDEITEVAFVNKNTNHTYISLHLIGDDGNYKIHNISATNKGESIQWTDDDYYIFDTKSNEPWFAVLQPNVANNIDIDSPLGISIFANQIDTLKEIDLVFDSLANEFALGKKRIFIRVKNINYDPKTGEAISVFDTNDVAFYVLPDPTDENQTFIQSDTQTLRVTEHEQALQALLNYYSYGCGFGTNHYKFDNGSVATATQVVSENSDLFRNIKKHEILIEDVLKTIVKAVIYATNTFTAQRIDCNPDNIQIKFDDSIIEDKQSEKTSDREDVTMGIMGKAEYRSKWYNEDIETAERKIEEIDGFTIDDYDEPEEDTEETPENGAENGETGESEEVDDESKETA